MYTATLESKLMGLNAHIPTIHTIIKPNWWLIMITYLIFALQKFECRWLDKLPILCHTVYCFNSHGIGINTQNLSSNLGKLLCL